MAFWARKSLPGAALFILSFTQNSGAFLGPLPSWKGAFIKCQHGN